MATWITPITDRSQEDVDRIRELDTKGYYNLTEAEKTEWESDSKGALNTSDLERIENNIKVISDMLDMKVSLLDVPELPNVSYFTNLLSRSRDIRVKALADKYSNTILPEQPLNKYWHWNMIEQFLFDVFTVLEANERAILYMTDDVELYVDSEVI